MTKKVDVDTLDAEKRHVLEAVIGHKLQPGERVSIQVWPPDTRQDDAKTPRVKLNTWPANVKGTLSRSEIYEDVI